jgi:BASS family bile acid:Na+ symporter
MMTFMPELLDITVPLYTFLVMFAVGTSLAVADFRCVADSPETVVLASLTHMICLPLAGMLVIQLLPLNAFVVAGVLLIAACPSGSIANLYVYQARANTALAVTLTGVSSLAALGTMPLVLLGFSRFLPASAWFHVPVLPLLRALVFFLVVPILLGMWLRHRRPEFVVRNDRWLRGGSLLLVVALITQILWQQAPQVLAADLAQTLQASVLMAGLAILAGGLLGRLLHLPVANFWTIVIWNMVQNLALAMTIAVTVYHQPRFATFAVVYFLVQVPIAAVLILACRWQFGRCRLPAPV